MVEQDDESLKYYLHNFTRVPVSEYHQPSQYILLFPATQYNSYSKVYLFIPPVSLNKYLRVHKINISSISSTTCFFAFNLFVHPNPRKSDGILGYNYLFYKSTGTRSFTLSNLGTVKRLCLNDTLKHREVQYDLGHDLPFK